MKGRTGRVGCVLLAVLFTLLFASDFIRAQQASPSAQPAPAAKKAAEAAPAPAQAGQEVVPGPRNPKERMGLYIFMAWLWISIIFLIFILGAKVKEADRLFEARYFKDEKHNHSD
jgi:hypothetical protein